MNDFKVITTTETYDPCYVEDYESKLNDANICITKELTDNLIDILVRNKHRMILHYTITGLGGSIYEPNVPNLSWSISQLTKLFNLGFPIKQFVLRLDPIIPATYPLMKAEEVLSSISTFYSGDKIRSIVSIIDQYSHVRKRMIDTGVELNYNTFHAPADLFNVVEGLLSRYSAYYDYQSCAESGFSNAIVARRGCISDLDLKLLNMDPNDFCPNTNGTRSGCLCLVKKNCLGVRPHQCPHKCIYCFWK